MTPILSPEAILDQIRKLKAQRDTARAWAWVFGLIAAFMVLYAIVGGQWWSGSTNTFFGRV